jgi:hypothetical protein
MQLNDLLQNWILCSSMWSSTTLDWEYQSKIGFHATQNSFIWAEDHSGKLHFGTWSCMQQFAGEDKYVSSMKSTPAWTNSDSNIKCLFLQTMIEEGIGRWSREWYEKRYVS